jgi:hypothetical protein
MKRKQHTTTKNQTPYPSHSPPPTIFVTVKRASVVRGSGEENLKVSIRHRALMGEDEEGELADKVLEQCLLYFFVCCQSDSPSIVLSCFCPILLKIERQVVLTSWICYGACCPWFFFLALYFNIDRYLIHEMYLSFHVHLDWHLFSLNINLI